MRLPLLSTTALVASALGASAQQTNWNGAFVGAQLGFNQHSATYEDIDYDWYGATMDFLSNGGSVGVQFGYNMVTNNRLVGVVADLSVLSNDETKIYASDDRVPNKAKYLATLRGRTGLAVDDTLVFVTAGLAFSKFERSWTEFNDPSDSWPDLGATKTGVVLGFGVEHKFNDRWSVSGEYTVSMFGENESINGNNFPLRINDNIHRLSVSFNYALGNRGGSSGSASGTGTPADFAGSYVGAVLGFGYGQVGQSDIAYFNHGGTYDVDSSGTLAGLTAGYNWQMGATVLGVEARYTSAQMSATYNSGSVGDIDSGINQAFSLRGRAGMAAGNTLMYVLGGVTVADVSNSFSSDEDLSDRYTGLTVGAGVEQMLAGNLSWNIEGTYTRYDGEDDSNGNLFHGQADEVRIAAGLNYHLGTSGSRAGSGSLSPTHDWSGGFYGVDAALLANKGSVWDQDYDQFGGTFDVTSLGGGIGAHVGFNWQSGSFVYGAIADIAAYSNDERRTSPGYREVASAIDMMATVRGRAGIASGQSLFYVTGGLALAKSELSHEEFGSTDSFDLDDPRVGTVVGMGLEHAFNDKMSFRVETLYSKFDDKSYYNGQSCSGPVGFDGGDCNMDGSDSNVQVKAGVSWAF